MYMCKYICVRGAERRSADEKDMRSPPLLDHISSPLYGGEQREGLVSKLFSLSPSPPSTTNTYGCSNESGSVSIASTLRPVVSEV